MIKSEDKVKLISLSSAMGIGSLEAFKEYSIAKCLEDIRKGVWDNEKINKESVYQYISNIYDQSYRLIPENAPSDGDGTNLIKNSVLNSLKHVRLVEAEHRLMEYPLKRYRFLNKPLKREFGFDIEDIVDFADSLLGWIKMDFRLKYTHFTTERKAFESLDRSVGSPLPLPKSHIIENWKEAITFKREELLKFLTVMNTGPKDDPLELAELTQTDFEDMKDLDHLKKIEKILDQCIFNGDEIEKYDNLIYDNPLRKKPILSYDDKIIVPVPFLLSELPNALTYELGIKSMGKGKFRDKSGKAFEKFAALELKYLFGKDNVTVGKHYNKHEGYPDVDILVEWRDKAIVGECTSVHLPREFHKDNDVLFDVFDSSMKKCYKQVIRAKESLQNNPREFGFEKEPDEIYPIIVTEIPILAFNPNLLNTTYLKKFMDNNNMAYALDIFSLQKILNKCYDAKEFTDFLDWRLDSINIRELGNFATAWETDSFVYFRIYGDRFSRKMRKMQMNFLMTMNIDQITSYINNNNRII